MSKRPFVKIDNTGNMVDLPLDAASLDGHQMEQTGVESDTTTIPTTAQVYEFVNKNITSEGTLKSAVAYQDNVSPNACPYALLNILGGMSYKSENLCPTATYNGVMNNTVAKSIDFGNLPNGTYSISLNISVNANNRILVLYYYNNNVIDNVNNIITTMTSTGSKTYTFTLDGSVAYDDIRLGLNTQSESYSITLDSLMLVKGSTAHTEYQPYFEGIRDSAVSSVISKDSNNTILQTINIPSAIQQLEGYGWGINDTCYNYIDLVNKKFIQKVGKRIFSSSDNIGLASTSIVSDGTNSYIRGYLSGISTNKQNNNILMSELPTQPDSYWGNMSPTEYISIDHNNGNVLFVVNTNKAGSTLESLKAWLYSKIFYYELATPIETDISQYLDDEFNSIQIEPNGTITFENTYQQAIPYEYLYDIGIIPIVDERLTNYLSKAKITLSGTTLTIDLD